MQRRQNGNYRLSSLLKNFLKKQKRKEHNMIHIAICDDKKNTTENLEELLLAYTKEKSLDAKILYFTTPSALYKHMGQESVDIVFMDLHFGLEQEDGILWASRIHRHFPQSLVIILTAYEDRYKEGYIAKAFRFMTKPFSQDELYENLNACLEELNLYKTILLLRHGNTHKIPILDILYFAAHSGGSELKTIHTSYLCEESLLQWEEKTAPNIFFRCHKKYLVNLNAIEQLKNHTILLKNGEVLPVSRRKWTLLKSVFIKFDIAMKGKI